MCNQQHTAMALFQNEQEAACQLLLAAPATGSEAARIPCAAVCIKSPQPSKQKISTAAGYAPTFSIFFFLTESAIYNPSQSPAEHQLRSQFGIRMNIALHSFIHLQTRQSPLCNGGPFSFYYIQSLPARLGRYDAFSQPSYPETSEDTFDP